MTNRPSDPDADNHAFGAAPTHLNPHAEPDGEQVYYEGSPKLRGELGIVFLWGSIGLVLFLVPILLRYYGGYEVPALVIGTFMLVGIALAAFPALLVRRNYYRITNYRIDYEHGLLFKKMDTLELWHVEDVGLSQSPIDRIFGVGTIRIVSNDATSPVLLLDSVQNPRPLFETIKQRIIAVKRQRGVVKLDI